MRVNFGLKLQNSTKLPHIHARFHCNANEQKLTVKRAIVQLNVFYNGMCLLQKQKLEKCPKDITTMWRLVLTQVATTKKTKKLKS